MTLKARSHMIDQRQLLVQTLTNRKDQWKETDQVTQMSALSVAVSPAVYSHMIVDSYDHWSLLSAIEQSLVIMQKATL